MGDKIELFSGTFEPTDRVYPLGEYLSGRDNLFGGYFAVTDPDVAKGHGPILQKFLIDEDKILSHDDLVHELIYEDGAQTILKPVVEHYIGKTLGRRDSEMTEDEAYDLAEFVAERKYLLHDDEFETGIDRLAHLVGASSTDPGEIDWRLQGIAGLVARKMGYDAVDLPDEHGESVLIVRGKPVEIIKGNPNVMHNPPVSYKESLSGDFQEGQERIKPNGELQILTRLPLDQIVFTPGNRIYEDRVRQYVVHPPARHPEALIVRGQFVLEDGNHTVAAAMDRGDKDMLVWVGEVPEWESRNPRSNYITLYRGLEEPFDPRYDLSQSDAPYGYSTWTDNIELARQYAGIDGFVYQIKLPVSEMGDDIIDADGERVLFLKNEKPAGLHGISGDEYLVYHDHDLYSRDLIREVKGNPVQYEETPERIYGMNPLAPEVSGYEGMKVEYTPFKFAEFKIGNPQDIVNFAEKTGLLDDVRERVYAIYFNQKNVPMGYRLMGAGSANACLVDPKEVFGPALALNAVAIAMLHNHPSGGTIPSPEDRGLSHRMVKIGNLMNIKLLDFIVVGRDKESNAPVFWSAAESDIDFLG